MFWCRFFGYGMVAVGLTFVPVATMTYVSDCYLPVNADALLLVNGLKVCDAARSKIIIQGASLTIIGRISWLSASSTASMGGCRRAM